MSNGHPALIETFYEDIVTLGKLSLGSNFENLSPLRKSQLLTLINDGRVIIGEAKDGDLYAVPAKTWSCSLMNSQQKEEVT